MIDWSPVLILQNISTKDKTSNVFSFYSRTTACLFVIKVMSCMRLSLLGAMEHGAMSPEYWPFSSIKTSLNFPYIVPTLVNIFQIITYSNENFNKKYVWHIPTLYDMKGMILKTEKALI